MDYIYDVVLNFQDKYYDFYEWCPSDNIINVKKIPIYKISTNDYLVIKNNIVVIDRNSLSKQSKMYLLTNGIEVMGILLNNKSMVLKISSLLFDEADEILEEVENIKLTNIKYEIIKSRKSSYLSRNNLQKQDYVSKYLKGLNVVNDEYLIKYLYYDIYNIDESDTIKVYNELLNLCKNDVEKIYNGIKKVNLEFKKSS